MALLETLGDTLAVVKTKTLGDTQRHLRAEALLKTLADAEAKVKLQALGITMGNVKVEALVHKLRKNLAIVKAATLCDIIPMRRPRHSRHAV